MDASQSISQQFAKAPKDFKGSKYKGLTAEAKLTYTWSLDTLQLSKLNHAENGGWFDFEKKQHFIFYSVEQIMNDLEVSKPKAIKIRKELEFYSLWEMVSQGANKPTKIFINEIIKSQDSNKKLRFNVLPKKEVKEENTGITVDGKEVDYREVF